MMPKKLDLKFHENDVPIYQVISEPKHIGERITGPWQRKQWDLAPIGAGAGANGGYNTYKKLDPNSPAFTQTSGHRHFCWDVPHFISDLLAVRLQSFPDDYDFGSSNPGYVCGMSVPPFMMQRVATEIVRQLFEKEPITPLRRGPWKLSEIEQIPKNGINVFSTFACGGGSTMGYKLAGFEVIGAVEIDKEMADIYEKNHCPRYLYRMPIQEFNKIPNADLPQDLFGIDVLDGSPPCSSFSMAGAREKKWGKARKFREGQAVQVLDDLFFHFIDTAEKLKPKVVVAENVKGLIQGNARGYVKQIFQKFRDIGYSTQLFLLNASRMGVPQRRERVFFISIKDDVCT